MNIHCSLLNKGHSRQSSYVHCSPQLSGLMQERPGRWEDPYSNFDPNKTGWRLVVPSVSSSSLLLVNIYIPSAQFSYSVQSSTCTMVGTQSQLSWSVHNVHFKNIFALNYYGCMYIYVHVIWKKQVESTDINQLL